MENSPKETNADVGRDIVQKVLAGYNLNASPIEESSHQTPDLELHVGSQRILIEVKSKEDDNQLRALLDSHAGATLQYKLSTIETVLKKAWHQLKKFPERKEDDFTVIWIIGLVPGLTFLMRPAAMSVLYGAQPIETRTNDGALCDKDCYFFNNSFFFRRKDLDAVVLHDENRVILCLNPFSNRRHEFHRGKFAQLFREYLFTLDPEGMEQRGECYIADCSISRNDINGVVERSRSAAEKAKILYTPFG
jgi:hypothetical protein